VVRAGRLVRQQVKVARQLDVERGDLIDRLGARVEHVRALEQFDAGDVRGAGHGPVHFDPRLRQLGQRKHRLAAVGAQHRGVVSALS
jgi:hypothetical protein